MAVLLGILTIDHCPAVAHHPRPGILPLTAHICHCSLVAISAARSDLRLLLEAESGQCLPRLLSVGLALFWRINGGKADFYLLVFPPARRSGP